MRKFLGSFIVGALFAAVGLIGMAIAAPEKQESLRFSITEQQDKGHAGLFLFDRKTEQAISIIAEPNGCYVAFYGPSSKLGTPDVAIGCNGIQLRTKTGGVQFITPDELATLDRHPPKPAK